jgi:hypothetical protein
MRRDVPKFFALMLCYLCDESLEAQLQQVKVTKRMMQKKYRNAMKKCTRFTQWVKWHPKTTKLLARSTYQHIRQCTYESIITYKEWSNSALKCFNLLSNGWNWIPRLPVSSIMVKDRMVADRKKQNSVLYPDCLSPAITMLLMHPSM